MIGNGTFLGVPVPMFILVAVAVGVAIILNKTRLGLSTYMIGSNIKATGFSGINTNKVTILVYMISGLLAGIASLIMIARFNSAKAGYLKRFESSWDKSVSHTCALGCTPPGCRSSKINQEESQIRQICWS